MIIKDKMVVLCRTKEQQEIYVEVATKEGWRFGSGDVLHTDYHLPMNYATGYHDWDTYPNAVTHGRADQTFPKYLTVVEASDLFRNQLIARRIKHEKGTT